MATSLEIKDLSSKLVQEIVLKGEEVPERHIVKDDDVIVPAIEAPSNVWEDRLLIDYSLLKSSDNSSSSAHHKELSKLHLALKEWGCFQVINHGMASSVLDELLEVTKQFFDLPCKEKLKYSIADDFFNGYANANEIAAVKALNWSDRLFLTVYPEGQRRLEFWPQKPSTFSETLNEYSSRIRTIMELLLKAVALSLDLKEDSFLKHHGERASISTRFGIYPRCPRPDKVYGVRPHTDKSTVTIVLQDKDVPEGLHIQKGDQWYKVPVVPGALFINLGDYAEVMSNGIYKSVVHRVMTNSVTDRVSIAAFCAPDPEEDVEPINELISRNQPKMYKEVNLKIYRQILFETYPQGTKVVDALKI